MGESKRSNNNDTVTYDADTVILQMNTLLDMLVAAKEDDMEALDQSKQVYLTRKEEGLFDPSSYSSSSTSDENDEKKHDENEGATTRLDEDVQRSILSTLEDYHANVEPKHVRTMVITDHGKLVKIAVPSLTPVAASSSVDKQSMDNSSRTSPVPTSVGSKGSKSGSGLVRTATATATTRSSSSQSPPDQEEDDDDEEEEEEEEIVEAPKKKAFVLDARAFSQQEAQQYANHPAYPGGAAHHPFLAQQQQNLQRNTSTRSHQTLPPIDDERSLISELTTPTVDTRHVPTQEEKEDIMSSIILENGDNVDPKTLELLEKTRLAKDRAAKRRTARENTEREMANIPPAIVARSSSTPVQQNYKRSGPPPPAAADAGEVERPGLDFGHPPPPSQYNIFNSSGDAKKSHDALDAWLASGSSPTGAAAAPAPSSGGGGAAQYRLKHSQQKGAIPATASTKPGVFDRGSTGAANKKVGRPQPLTKHNRSVTDPGSQRFDPAKTSASSKPDKRSQRSSYHVNDDVLADVEGPNYFPSYMRQDSSFTKEEDDDSEATPKASAAVIVGGGVVSASANAASGGGGRNRRVSSSVVEKTSSSLDPFKKSRRKSSKLASSIGGGGKKKNLIWNVKGAYGNSITTGSGGRKRQSTRQLLSGSDKLHSSSSWGSITMNPNHGGSGGGGISSSVRKGSLDKKLNKGKKKKGAMTRSAVGDQGGQSRELDGAVAGMGKDIDYLFRELSVVEDDDEDDDKSVASMMSTAKMKYALRNVASSLRDVSAHVGGDEDGNVVEDSKPKKSAATPQQPLMIDEDGFILGGGVVEDDDAFSTFGGEKAMAAKKSSDGFFSDAGDWWGSSGSGGGGGGDAFATSKKSSSATARQSKTAAAAASQKQQQKSAEWKKAQESKEARIEAVEKATKKRMAMLRKLVAEREALEMQEGEDYDGAEQAQLQAKLDFVEAETMKQIEKLREKLHTPDQPTTPTSKKRTRRSVAAGHPTRSSRVGGPP